VSQPPNVEGRATRPLLVESVLSFYNLISQNDGIIYLSLIWAGHPLCAAFLPRLRYVRRRSLHGLYGGEKG